LEKSLILKPLLRDEGTHFQVLLHFYEPNVLNLILNKGSLLSPPPSAHTQPPYKIIYFVNVLSQINFTIQYKVRHLFYQRKKERKKDILSNRRITRLFSWRQPDTELHRSTTKQLLRRFQAPTLHLPVFSELF
jgi:hypothetical protein